MKNLIIALSLLIASLFVFEQEAMAQQKIQEISDEISLTIDYSLDFQETNDAGNYCEAENAIKWGYLYPPSFKPDREMSVVGKIFKFKVSSMERSQIDKELDSLGYRQASWIELFALGEAYPEIVKEFETILAFESVHSWETEGHGEGIVCLYQDDSWWNLEKICRLDVYWWMGPIYDEDFSFFAIQK